MNPLSTWALTDQFDGVAGQQRNRSADHELRREQPVEEGASRELARERALDARRLGDRVGGRRGTTDAASSDAPSNPNAKSCSAAAPATGRSALAA